MMTDPKINQGGTPNHPFNLNFLLMLVLLLSKKDTSLDSELKFIDIFIKPPPDSR